ncbi:MAG TPA: glycosyltransferase family 39 protein, partial [Vicinamibacteria bacterium]
LYWGDSMSYDAGGYVLAQTWTGEAFVTTSGQTMVSGYGFHYFVAFIYYFFGRNQLLVQFINGTISASAALVIYSTARDLYGPAPARWALLFMSFFPQMVFWSCAMYKDPSILLCIAISIHSVLRLRDRFSGWSLLLFVAATLALMTLRFYVFYMVAFAAVGTFLFSQRRGLLGGLAGQAVLAIVFFSAVTLGVRRETIDQQAQYFDLEKLQNARLDQSMRGQSAFASQIDVSTREGVAAAIPIGLVYLLFAPFPWSISGVRQLLTLPETLVWYALMPALLRGLIVTVRTRFRDALPMLVFAATLTLAYAAFQSNVGTAYRQRTQITMFFFILIGVGIEHKRMSRAPDPARAVRPRVAVDRQPS